MKKIRAYKVFSHKYCSPIQGGPPVWNGTLPYTLPTVAVDDGEQDCAAGWNACENEATAVRIAGLWRDGWPAKLYAVETDAPVLVRGDKLRAATWDIVEELPMTPVIHTLSEAFGPHAQAMYDAQIAWYAALGRPGGRSAGSAQQVERSLRGALAARGLQRWTLRRHQNTRDARAAQAAWDAPAAWNDWDARKDWDDWNDDVWDTWDAWEVREARAALMWRYATLNGWVQGEPEKYEAGIRAAYHYGLHFVIPTGKNELGWVMTTDA